jgi:hypothetical protein
MNVWSLNMKRIHYFIFIYLSFIFLFPCYAVTERGLSVKPISPLGTEIKGNQWLFVIGINTYIYWPHLKTAVNDAKALKNVLLSRYYFDEDLKLPQFSGHLEKPEVYGQEEVFQCQRKKERTIAESSSWRPWG